MKRLGWSERPQGNRTNCRLPPPSARWGSRRCTRPSFVRARHAHRAGAADARRPGRPRALPQRALDAAARCCACGVVPVINENDTVVTDEIKFGDNDTLGALVANLIEADALVHPHRPDGPVLGRPAQGPERAASSTKRRRRRPSSNRWPAARAPASARGGMITKILAAKRAASSGANTVIAWRPRARCPAAPGGRRGHRYGAHGADTRQARGAQAMDGRSPAAAREGRRRRGRGDQVAGRGQEPAADRRAWRCRVNSIAATSSRCV